MYRRYNKDSRGFPQPIMHQAEYIDLPISVIDQCNGLGIDFGGSVMKIVYRPKDKSVREGEPPVANGKERIRLVSFSRPQMERALSEIAGKADIRRQNEADSPLISTTGVGSNQFSKRIEEVLKITTRTITEFDCFINCFKELIKTSSKDELVDPPHAEGAKAAQKLIDIAMGTADKWAEHSEGTIDYKMPTADGAEPINTADVPYAEADKDLLPCLIVMLGSAFGCLKIEKDGTFAAFDGTTRGGRSFLGIGNLLTGANSYEELTGLAEHGDDKEVNTYTQDMKLDAAKDDMYALTPDDMLCYNFGKAVTGKPHEFRRESVARALVVHYATDVTQMAHTAAALAKTKNIFYVGNFCNADVIRREVTREQALRLLAPISDIPFNFHFLKHGGFLGAIGAYIAPTWYKTKKEAETA